MDKYIEYNKSAFKINFKKQRINLSTYNINIIRR